MPFSFIVVKREKTFSFKALYSEVLKTGTYPKNVEKTKTCICEKFSPGGEFSETKVADVCGSNPGTPPKHLRLLQDKIVCGQKKLVKVEGTNRWTLVVPDDPFDDLFDDSLESDKTEEIQKVSGADLVAGLTLFTGIMVPVVLGLSKRRKLRSEEARTRARWI